MREDSGEKDTVLGDYDIFTSGRIKPARTQISNFEKFACLLHSMTCFMAVFHDNYMQALVRQVLASVLCLNFES